MTCKQGTFLRFLYDAIIGFLSQEYVSGAKIRHSGWSVLERGSRWRKMTESVACLSKVEEGWRGHGVSVCTINVLTTVLLKQKMAV